MLKNIRYCADLHSNQEEVVWDDLEQVLLVFTEQHQTKDCVVHGEPEESLAVGSAGEPVVPGLKIARGRSKGKMSIL